MRALLLVTLTVFSVLAQNCDYNTQYKYYTKCVAKTCVDNMLATLKTLTNFGPQIAGAPGQFGVSAAYDPVAAQGYSITLSYPDGANGVYLLQDQVNCVGFTVYSMTDATFTKRTPAAVTVNTANPEGVTANWPTATYNQGNFRGNIIVRFAQGDLATYCSSASANGVNTFTCYFDLAFQIAGATQQSNYFSIQIQQTSGAASVNLQVNKRAQTATQLVQKVQIGTKLEVCYVQVFPCPATTSIVFVGDPFYLKHSITDAGFLTYKINSPLVVFSGPNIGGNLPIVTTQYKGYNVYSTMAVLQYKDGFTITASGLVSPTRRILATTATNKATKGKVARSKNNQIKGTAQTISSKVTFSESSTYTGNTFLLNNPALKKEYYLFLNLTDPMYNATNYITSTSMDFVTKKGKPTFQTVQSTLGSNVYKFVQSKALSNQWIKITGVLKAGQRRILAAQQYSKSALYVRQTVQLPSL